MEKTKPFIPSSTLYLLPIFTVKFSVQICGGKIPYVKKAISPKERREGIKSPHEPGKNLYILTDWKVNGFRV